MQAQSLAIEPLAKRIGLAHSRHVGTGPLPPRRIPSRYFLILSHFAGMGRVERADGVVSGNHRPRNLQACWRIEGTSQRGMLFSSDLSDYRAIRCASTGAAPGFRRKLRCRQAQAREIGQLDLTAKSPHYQTVKTDTDPRKTVRDVRNNRYCKTSRDGRFWNGGSDYGQDT